MFKRENRLVPGVSFSGSHLIANPQFVIKEKKNGLTVNRFGIVVSKKVDKRAVGRNKVKRFIRTALLDLSEKMNAGHDILLIAKKEILNKTEEENLLAIKSSLDRLGIINK